MDDSFRLRVAKIFGSLAPSSSQQPSSLWSLTDGEVQKREWKRGDTGTSDRDDMPCSSSFDELKKDRRRRFRRVREDDVDEFDEEEDDDDDDEESNLSRRRGGGMSGDGVDEWDIRSSIGLDRTLDNEEEEDEFDKVASGTDTAGRIYMKNVNNQEAFLNIHNVIPNSSYGSKDPRANYIAAKIRLREDEDEAKNLNSPHDGEKENKELHAEQYQNASELRSILKRKDNSSDSKSHKRVRFDPGCNIVTKDESDDETQSVSMDSSSHNSTIRDGDSEHIASKNIHGVPDYLRNPSKYTCYSFDSTEVEEESNTQACMDFLNMVNVMKSSGSQNASFDLPKSVTFIPKKKGCESTNSNKAKQHENETDDGQSLSYIGVPVGIAARESDESEANAMDMEEDEPGTDTVIRTDGSKKSGRKYRMKSGDAEESTP
ncbi:uncharacterized protein [Euphorbia lathyris]|uniref:uncharacterized protein n=1 Tax=Euphorbia lathyris TaxID=212925 RepID=UPI0033136811